MPKHKLLVFSLLLAGFLVFSLSFCSSSQETDILIPVDLEKIPQGLTVTGLPLKNLEVKVCGSKSVIKILQKLQPRYTLNLSDINEGVKTINVEPEKIPLPSGIIIMDIKPAFIILKIEKELEKELPVIISLSGKPATGFFVADTTAKPPSIILRGPESILGLMKKAVTKPVDVSGLK
ncbi:MAG: YbbR-like domain-containing protein, partial [Deltaproteobacteria bacterium]|nr:YbbR-like domain-containing protein [Deltaproteobacteria bacterium]